MTPAGRFILTTVPAWKAFRCVVRRGDLARAGEWAARRLDEDFDSPSPSSKDDGRPAPATGLVWLDGWREGKREGGKEGGREGKREEEEDVGDGGGGRPRFDGTGSGRESSFIRNPSVRFTGIGW